MKIHVGKTYKTRNGKIVTIISNNSHILYPYNGDNDLSYTVDGEWDHGGTTKHDLIVLIDGDDYEVFPLNDLVTNLVSGSIYYTKEGNKVHFTENKFWFDSEPLDLSEITSVLLSTTKVDEYTPMIGKVYKVWDMNSKHYEYGEIIEYYPDKPYRYKIHTGSVWMSAVLVTQ